MLKPTPGAIIFKNTKHETEIMKNLKADMFRNIVKHVKSVQPTLSHLQSPPEQMQSQHNYDSFL